MEIINKKSVSIRNNNARSLQRRYVAVDDVRLYFTAALVRDFDINVGEYMHFMNEGSKWQFFMNDDNDGFLITKITSKGGVNVTNSALCRLIQKSTGYTTQKNYEVVRTGFLHDNCPVFEIITT